VAVMAVIDPMIVCRVVDDLVTLGIEDPQWLCDLIDKVSAQGGRITNNQCLVLKKIWYKYNPGCMPPWTKNTGV